MALSMPKSARGWVAWLSPGFLILVGAALFFIPAPPTSLIGVGLMVVGAALWIVDYFGGEERGRVTEPEAAGLESEPREETPPGTA